MFSSYFFKNNRKELMNQLENNSCVLFHAKDPYIKGDDSFFSQIDSNLFYFSGIEQKNTILFIGRYDDKIEEKLFIEKQDTSKIIWEGEFLTKKKAKSISGISKIYYRDDFEKEFDIVKSSYSTIYLPNNWCEVGKSSATLFFEKIKSTHSFIFRDITPCINKLRRIKQKEEINAIKEAISITKKGIINVMKNWNYYKYEAEIQGELSKIYTSYFSQHSFHPVIASGSNATTLHYNLNNKKLKKNELVLIDTGAEYNNYKGDITRVIPVSSKFTKRQKEIYNAVLRVQKYAFSILKPGVNRKEYEKKIVKKMGDELVSLRLFSQKAINDDITCVRKYFPHSTSHFLGLDTHDLGEYYDPIKEGEVLTVEPGIYSRDESIGIRIEDVVVITKTGCKNLSKSIPKSVDEIESIIGNKKK